MTTYTWSAETLTADWADPGNWTSAPSASPVPGSGQGDAVVIGYGTVELDGTPQYDIAITLQPVLHAFGVELAATNVDFGDNSVLTIGPPATPGQPIALDVIGDGILDDANPTFGLSPQAGTIDFSAAGSSIVNLTIEISPSSGRSPVASFTNDGVMRGDDLTITADAGTAATFVNNTTLQLTGGLTVDAGVALDGSGIVDLDGTEASASIGGAVGIGQTIEFDHSVQTTLTIGDIAQFQGTVELSAENQIVVTGVSLNSVANGLVTFSDGSTLDVVPAGDGGNIVAETLSYDDETLIDATHTSAPCFCTGAQIATEAGDVPVEALRAGMVVRLASGGVAKVVWVGHRDVRCDRHPRPHDVWPVRVHAGAVAPGVPRRDLLLSPDHAVAVAGHLIPVRHLLNGATVVQEPAETVRYHHVELARHDLLLAEGLAAESYLDTGNRAAFAGGGPALALHPAFSRSIWAEAACAPLVESGPALAAARRTLLRQAGRLGHRRTRDAAVCLSADGRPLHTASGVGGWLVHLPPGVREVRLRSRIWVPAQMRPDENDTRRLGIAVGRLWLDGREVSLDSPALSRGWHPPEPGARWTDGDATLAVAGARMVGFALAMSGSYWRIQDNATRQRA